MRRAIRSIGIISAIITALVCAYLLGTSQAKTKVEIKIITEEVKTIPDGYIPLNEEFRNNFVDMRKVTDYTANGDSLQIYLDDGSGYYWER